MVHPALPVFAAVAALALPALAEAQSRLRLTAGFEAAEVYDDNLFPDPASRVRESDFVYRLGPRIGLAYGGRALQVAVRGGRQGEMFGWRRELNSTAARQDALVDVGWSPARGLTLEGGFSYADTTAARDLNLAIPLESGRLPAQRWSARAAAGLRVGGRTRLRVEHTSEAARTTGYPSLGSRLTTLGLDRRSGPTGSAGLSVIRRDFDAGGPVTTSHALVAAWSRQATPRAHIEIAAGPRLSDDGDVGAEIAVGLRALFERGEVVATYRKTEATALGYTGRLRVDSVTATFRQDIARGLSFRGGPGIYTSRRGTSELIVYVAGAELEYRFGRRLGLTASHLLSLQQGALDPGPARRDVPHNVFSLRLVAGEPGS